MSMLARYVDRNGEAYKSKWDELDLVLSDHRTISVDEAYDLLLGIDPNATYENARAHMLHLKDSGKATMLDYMKNGNELFILNL